MKRCAKVEAVFLAGRWSALSPALPALKSKNGKEKVKKI